ncbi:MAG: S-adenosylmethionine:tRNA ribosyltransferase-isomerase [Lachnoclostridium sp.]|nr:S-adenosylmethionine:tRNA ribosyltransferase-isomerase [Lachnoclostridium sp.]
MNPSEIRIEDYNYPLPDHRIALHPLQQRDECKLLVLDGDGSITTHRFDEVDRLLPGDALLVYNNTRVINARLRFRKGENHDGALVEIFCLEPVAPVDYALNFASTEPVEWKCMIGNSKRWKDGVLTMPLDVDGAKVTLTAFRVEKNDDTSVVRFSWDNKDVTFSSIISAAGEIPIPPYLNRKSEASDNEDYQTVFNRFEGSVAAPTAGLHFTPQLLEKISLRGIPRREVTLHVGAGTFQPVKSDTIGDHHMHSEFISVDRAMIQELMTTSRHVFAVGTTSVRTLESLYHLGCMAAQGMAPVQLDQWYPYSSTHPRLTVAQSMQALIDYLDSHHLTKLIASTRLMIAPGYKYMIVKGMITNFHQPCSTLLLLVSAMIGERWREVYTYALDNDYRFLSYGDACLFMNTNVINS